MSRRPSRAVGRRFIVEYVSNTYPNPVWVSYNQRVGPTPEALAEQIPDEAPRMFEAWKKYADAVVVTQDEIHVVEAEMRRPILAIGSLLVYESLVQDTPDLARFLGRRVHLVIATPVNDPTVIPVARKLGMEYALFRPDWAVQYLREVGLG